MSERRSVEVACEDGVARIALNRPEVRNAFNAEMIARLTEVFLDVSGRDDVRAVVLRGEGRSFSAGADAEWMRGALAYSREENAQDARRLAAMFQAIDDTSQPVIARVHGAALGGAMGLLAASDVVVAADDARFGFTEVNLGLIPAVISAWVLPRIGESWARALYTTGEQFDAGLARHIGLVHWICSPDDLDAAVEQKVGAVTGAAPLAVRSAKALVSRLRGLNSAEMIEMTADAIADTRVGPEAQEGLRAFLEKRPPAWRGD